MPYTPDQHRLRVKRYRLEVLRGVQHRVPSTAVRAHVATLIAAGMTKTAIARAAGYQDGSTLSSYLRRDVLSARTEARILAIAPRHTTDTGRAYRILAIGAQRRVQALSAIGWALTDLPAHCDVGFNTLRSIRDARYSSVLSPIDLAVRDLYEALSMTPGTSEPARRAARRNGWAPPLAWDEDALDDPTRGPLGLPPDANPARVARALGLTVPAAARALGVSERTIHTLTGPMAAKTSGLEALIENWHDTWDHHQGDLDLAATRLGTDHDALERQLCRAQRAGITVRRALAAA